MLVYWMPYLTLAYPHRGERIVRVGKAEFFEDTPAKWTQVVGCPRPPHLNIHRDFPTVSGEPGDPLFGTLVRSEDEDWLTEHFDAAVAVLYFVGDEDERGRPAECFAYHRLALRLGTDRASDLVGYWTKHGHLIESSDSLTLLPPLPVRGNLTAYRIQLTDPQNLRLLQRFEANPHDRLVVAVRHYFRSQFSDIFTSPPQEDYALQCGAIEAAFDIDALKPGVAERFVEALAKVFGRHDRFEEFFLGLYASRSVFVHGVSAGETEGSADKKATAYRMFQQVKCKITLLRRLTRDVILEALGRPKDEFRLLGEWSVTTLLAKVLHSTATWQRAKQTLNRSKAADSLAGMSDEEFRSVAELAYQVGNYFDWQCVEEAVDENQVYKALCTCALVLGRLTGSAGPVYAESDKLGRAAAAKDRGAVESWVFSDPWHDMWLRDGDRVSTFGRLARGLAFYFRKRW